MADVKSISNEIKHNSSDIKAAAADLASDVAADVRHIAHDAGKARANLEQSLREEIEGLRKDANRILDSLRAKARHASADVADAAQIDIDKLSQEAQTAGQWARAAAAKAADGAETTISQHPFASMLISFGVGLLVSQVIRRTN